jgi:intracellular multiplication protein IcmE
MDPGVQSPQGKTLDKGLRRNLVIIGGVLVATVVGVVVLFMSRSSGSSDGKGAADLHAINTQPTGNGQSNPQGVSPATRDMLQKAQLEEAEAARRKGQSYVPADQMGAPIKVEPQGAQGANGQFVPNAQTGAQPIQVSEQERRRDDMRQKGLEAQIKALLGATVVGEAPTRVEFKTAGAAAAANGNGSVTGQQRQQDGGAAQAPDQGPVVVDALEIFAGSTASPMDTYKTGWASARINSGRLQGAYLIGNATMIDEGLQVVYTAMRWNGKTYKVDAIALDESEATNAVSADLDHRYMQRYVMPVLMAAVGGYTTARAQTGSQVVATTTGVSISQPAPTKEQAINAGEAAATGIAQRAVDKEAQMPIRASLPANSPIGIMFRQPLRMTDQGTTSNTGVTKPNAGITAAQAVQLGAGGRNAGAANQNPYQVIQNMQTPATNQVISVPGFNGQVTQRSN